MYNILIAGASGHSKMIVDIINKNSNYKIVGYIDSFKKAGEIIYGYEILGDFEKLNSIIDTYNIKGIIIGIGDNTIRKNIKDKITKIAPNLNFITAIHPNAVLANDIIISEGTVIMAGAIINADAKVGKFCIINSNASLGHESIMEDFSSLSPGVSVGGNVKIGMCTVIGLKAGLKQGVTIGKYSIIGAGSLVLKPVGDYVMAYGVPIRVTQDIESEPKNLK